MDENDLIAARVMADFRNRTQAKWASQPPSSQWQGPIISETKTFAPLTPVRFADGSNPHKEGILAAILSDFVYVDSAMYPWPDPLGFSGGPFYADTDLPATFTFIFDGSPVTMTQNPGTYDYYDNISSPTYQISANPGFVLYGHWSLLYSGAGPGGTVWVSDASNTCLIGVSSGAWIYITGPDGSHVPGVALDNFLNTYTVNGTDVITRPDNTKGNWAGGKTGGGIWDLRYDLTAYKFRLTSDVGDNNLKGGNQDLPTGTFGANSVA